MKNSNKNFTRVDTLTSLPVIRHTLLRIVLISNCYIDYIIYLYKVLEFGYNDRKVRGQLSNKNACDFLFRAIFFKYKSLKFGQSCDCRTFNLCAFCCFCFYTWILWYIIAFGYNSNEILLKTLLRNLFNFHALLINWPVSSLEEFGKYWLLY